MTVCQANDRRRTDPKETPGGWTDEAGTVMPDAICTLEYEARASPRVQPRSRVLQAESLASQA